MAEKFQGDKKVGHSILHVPECKLRDWLLPLVPRGVETYHLTLTTIVWSLLIMFFSFLAQSDIRWLWGASVMIFFQYVTDLLDGAIGRTRNTGLIKWGYYMDHFLDYMFLCAILIGYSFLVQDHNKYILFFILALFGAFMVNSFLSFAATNEFQIAYLGIGPTEIRIVFIAINTVLILLKGNSAAELTLPYVLWFSTFGLFVAVYRTQEHIWDLDMKNKYGEQAVLKAQKNDVSIRDQEWTLYLSRRKLVRYLGLSFLMAFVALAVLMMRLTPFYRSLSVFIYAVGWIPLILSFWGRRALLIQRGRQVEQVIHPYVPYIVTALLLIVSAYVTHVLIPVQDTNLINMTDKDLREELDKDVRNIGILTAEMDSLVVWINEKGVFSKPVGKLSTEDKARVKETWRQFAALSLELDIMKSKYKGFYQIDRLAKRVLHADAFFVQFAAFITQYRSSLKLVTIIEDNEFMDTMLNEADAKYAIPKNSYSVIQQRLTNPHVLIRLNAWSCYFQLVKKDISKEGNILSRIDQDVEDIYVTIGKRPSILVKNPRDFFETHAFSAWFPFQQEVALQMGRIRDVTHEYRITQTDIAIYRNRLEPGDVILQRRNWVMANVGIPGFWPHVALYVGTLDELDKYFQGINILGGKTVSDYIKDKYPEVYKHMRTFDKNGFEHSVLEALEEGIIFTSCEYTLNADYVGVMRPRISMENKFQALLNAFGHAGKPYDFNFDFATDSKLVCSELIYKAYADISGMSFEPVILNGRLLITPNFFAEKFDIEYGAPSQEFDFVLFIDSSEKKNMAFEGSLEAFRQSWKRPKWDIMME